MNIYFLFIFASAFSDIAEDISQIFVGTENSIFAAEPELMGVFVLLIFLVLTLVLGLGMLIGSVVLIPSLFLIFQWIPSLKIIVAIIMGIILGLALQKIVKR